MAFLNHSKVRSTFADHPAIPKPLPNDRSPEALVINKLRTYLAAADLAASGTGSLATPDPSDVDRVRLQALFQYLIGGPEVLRTIQEAQIVIGVISREEAVDHDQLTEVEQRALQIEKNSRIGELEQAIELLKEVGVGQGDS